MHQATQGRLVWLEVAVATAQGVAHARHLQAAAPYVAHFLFDHLGAGVKDLLHHQADGQVAAVVGTKPGDGGVQVGDFLAGP